MGCKVKLTVGRQPMSEVGSPSSGENAPQAHSNDSLKGEGSPKMLRTCNSGSFSFQECRSSSWEKLNDVVETRLSLVLNSCPEKDQSFDEIAAFQRAPSTERDEPIIHVVSENASGSEKRWHESPKCIDYGPIIGTGSSGSVYRADVNGQQRAMKVIMCTAKDLKKVLIESEMGCGLDHPNIAKVFSYRISEMCDHLPGYEDSPFTLEDDYLSEEGKRENYVVEIEQELCGEGPLRKLIKAEDFFVDDDQMSKLDRVCLIALDIINALIYLEEYGVSHNDISSNNVLFVDDSSTPIGLRAKLVDFGMASPVSKETPMGTMPYMPPEIILDHHYDSQTTRDVYSLGVLLLEMWQSKHVWEGVHAVQILYAMSVGKRIFVPEDIPSHLYTLLCNCLHDDPQERPTLLELQSELSSFVSSGSLSAYQP